MLFRCSEIASEKYFEWAQDQQKFHWEAEEIADRLSEHSARASNA